MLSEIFSAYTFEETILSLANTFLDKEGFEQVEQITELRQRGWRPRGQVCEGCKKRTWGPGAGSGIWEAWERESAERARKKAEVNADEGGKGKGKSSVTGVSGGAEDAAELGTGALVVFACRHMWHRTCLEKSVEGDAAERRSLDAKGRFKCPICV